MEKMQKKYRTAYKFYPTNFLMGWGSIFNLYGNYFKFKVGKSAPSASETLANDWKMIAQDMQEVISKYPLK
jgi:hypothetical protein